MKITGHPIHRSGISLDVLKGKSSSHSEQLTEVATAPDHDFYGGIQLVFALGTVMILTTVAAMDMAPLGRNLPLLPPNPQPNVPRQCEPLDYRSELPPAKTQGDTAFCFAYSSTELINQRLGVSVSALDIAMAFYFEAPSGLRLTRARALSEYLRAHPQFEADIEHDRLRPDVEVAGPQPFFHRLEGGFERPSLLLANTRGLCLERDLPSEDGLERYEEVLNTLEARALRHVGEIGYEVARIPPHFRTLEADLFHTAWLRWTNQLCRRRPPMQPLVPVEFALADSSQDFAERRARGEITRRDRARLFASLDYALTHHRVAAVGLDLNAYLTLTSMGRSVDDGDHSMTVVARRARGPNCEYLLRDSSGYGCDDFQGRYRHACFEKHIWFSEEDLARTMYSVVYLR